MSVTVLEEEGAEGWIAQVLEKNGIKGSIRGESSKRFEGEKESVIVTIEDQQKAFDFFREGKFRPREFFGIYQNKDVYLELKMDIEKLEAYADEAAEKFAQLKEEKGEEFAIRNQFPEARPPRPDFHQKKPFFNKH